MILRRKQILVSTSILVVVVFNFVIFELGIRALLKQHDHGYEYLPILGRKIPVPPYPPVQLSKLEKTIQNYRESDNSILVYDPRLGWTYRPDTKFADRGMAHNNDGIRTETPQQIYLHAPTDGLLRIALFGDSHTHGDGADYLSTWGSKLQQRLLESGKKVEVLNFGVGGYGMDQAYLRYLEIGVKYEPDIVIFGFSVENMFRNINIFRDYYKKKFSGIPLSKPRFTLEEDELLLVNSPTVPIDKIPIVLENFSDGPLAEHETFYRDDEYQDRFWHQSRFLSAVIALIRHHQLRRLDDPPNGKAFRLMIKIITEFRDHVEENNGQFLIAHLPPANHFEYFQKNNRFKYETTLEYLERLAPVFRPEKSMLSAVDEGSVSQLFADHYSTLGHEAIGYALGKLLVDQWQTENQSQ
ncbi:SGNH/GDSL hydrolase family protein [Arenicellales bacterium nBUS_45]